MTSLAPAVADELYDELESALASAKSKPKGLYQAIVQVPFDHDRDMAFLFLGFLTLFILDPKRKMIVASAATDNDYYDQSIAGYDFKLSDYQLPLSAKENSVVQAITSGQPVTSDNWDTFKRPKVDEGVARLNQANCGIGYAAVYPIQGIVRGALMFNFYQFPEAMCDAQDTFMQRYSALVAEALT